MTNGVMSERSVSPAAQASQSIFGKYVLLRKLASGGMGEIFLAKQRDSSGFEDLRVIKRILSHHLDKKDYLDMFFSEAELVGRLNHHNIIRIHEMSEIDGDHYIAMEYVRGKSLRDVIDELRAEGRSMPVAHVVELGIKLCEGLGYAHQARDLEGRQMNIVHRDINPHNILISYEGDLKLIDFGIAKSEMTSVHTATGTIKGKFVYMSPEQSAADPLDRRSDIFSAGIVLYEMLALENPFVRQNVVLSLEAIQRQAVAPPSKRRPDTSALDEVLLKALQKAPEHRYQTAIEMRDALKALRRSGQVPPADTELSTFLHSLFTADIAEEDRLLAEAERAAEALPPPSPEPVSLVAADTDELIDAVPRHSPQQVRPPSAFLDEEPTVAGDPDHLAQLSLEVSAQVQSMNPPGVHSQRPLFEPSPMEGRSSAIAAAGVVGPGPAESLSQSAHYSAPPATTPGRTPASLPPVPPRSRMTPLRVAAYALIFLLTTLVGYMATWPFVGRSTGASMVPISAEPEEPIAPPPAAPTPVVAKEEPPPPAEPPALEAKAVAATAVVGEVEAPEEEAPAPKRVTRRRRRPRRRRTTRKTAPKPAPKVVEAPAPAAVAAETPKPEAPAPIRGRVTIEVSAPVAIVADGSRLGASPATYAVRKGQGRLVISGGRDVDYAISLGYTVRGGGLAVTIDSSPWAIVQHQGLSLGKTPRGPVGPARRHEFSLKRPGQSVPLVLTLVWSPQ